MMIVKKLVNIPERLNADRGQTDRLAEVLCLILKTKLSS